MPMQRPNKLLRTRESVNQTKIKDPDQNLMETSLMILDASISHTNNAITKSVPSTSYAYNSSTALSSSSFLAAPLPSTSGQQQQQQLSNQIPLQSFIHSALTQPSTSQQQQPHSKSQAINQDGNTSLIMVQSAIPSTSNSNITEPELVLSPATLGQ